MPARFEIGKSYQCGDSGFDPIRVVKRSKCYCSFESSSGKVWRMLLRTDKDGNEYVRDSIYGSKWQSVFTYEAKREVAV